MENEPPLDPLLEKAITCLKAGYFQGALPFCETLERRGRKHRDAVRHVAWLARVYLGGRHRDDALRMRGIADTVSHLAGGQGLIEAAILAVHAGRAEKVAIAIQRILDVAATQSGVLITYHPTGLLESAEFALHQLHDEASALKLINCALGFRGEFLVLQDVERLGRLLAQANAPLPLWADWGGIFIRHTSFSMDRPRFLHEALNDQNAVRWATNQDAASEGVLRRTLAAGPPQLLRILMRLAPQLGRGGLATILSERFSSTGGSHDAVSVNPLWLDPAVLKLRYFWYDMLAEKERHLLRNADWAMFATPTPDFSMALAQWWRLLESVLKRSLAKELASLFHAHPEWSDWDRNNLSERTRKREAVFVDKLAAPDKWQRLTLGDLVLVMKKCLPGELTTVEDAASGSRLRKEATRFLNQHRERFAPLVSDEWYSVAHLTDENIDLFRNQSSHDKSTDIVDASVGRLVGKRVLNMFFAPLLAQWGFTPAIYVGIER
ncbi:hypothetical protein PQR71_07040 [Paraburkholderia fungorum]|uniref:hypothetical protein n=1 Tax=Paraburkholderia fungorum TaxID=134537 RepID=UPI0038B9A8EE